MRIGLLIITSITTVSVNAQNIGIGTTLPKAKFHLHTTEKDTTLLITADNQYDFSSKMVIENRTMGSALAINNYKSNSSAWGISVYSSENTGGIKVLADLRYAVYGVNNSYGAAALRGDNSVGTGVFGLTTGTDTESYGVVGNTQGDGGGVYGLSSGTGYGIVGRGGISGSISKAARFEVINPNSTSNAVEMTHNGTGTLLFAYLNNSTGTNPIAHFTGGGSRPHLMLQHTSSSDFARLRMTNQFTSTNQYWDIASYVSYNTPSSSMINFFIKANSGSGGNVMQITGAGNLWIAGTLTQNSDARLKKDITPLSGSLQKITSVSGYRYHWNDSARGREWQTGVLAQEIEQTFPELVKEDAQGTKSVNYLGLIPHLIESIKDQQQQIEILRTELQQLKNNIQQHSK